MRIVFLGSGEFALPTLQMLGEHHEVAAVVTQPDRPAGRKRRLTPTPIAAWARRQGLAIIKTDNVNDPGMIQRIASLKPEAGVIVAFGQKLSPPLIAALGELAINLHGSLLPRYRGAAPVNWAILDGERETGVSVIALAQRMDAGAVYATAATPIRPRETAGELHDRLAQLGPAAVGRVLDDLAHDRLEPIEQDAAAATRAPKLTKAHGSVDFARPAQKVCNRILGLTPWPGCRVRWTCQVTGKTQPLLLRRAVVDPAAAPGNAAPGTVLDAEGRVAAADGSVVRLGEVQTPGSRPMPVEDFARGHRLGPGDVLEPWRG